MKSEKPSPHYRDLLRRELESRSARNTRYSLRSFARDLKLSPQRLSDLIRGRYGLSSTQASQIASELGLTGVEFKRFVASAEMFHARSSARRDKAREEFTEVSNDFSNLSLDSFQFISEWYHYAILELTYVEGFQPDVAWISKRLGIQEFVTEQAIERLRRLDLLEVAPDGTMRCTREFVATPSGIPSDALRKFHRHLLEKAIQSLDLQTVRERDVSSVVMAVDTSRLDEAKEDLRRYRREFAQKYGSGPGQNEVYCLGVQFFRLQEKG